MKKYTEGTISAIDKISPSYINIKNPKMIEIDGIYYSCLLIVDYAREQTDLIFKNIVDTNENICISMYYEKQDTYKVIKDLTYNIGNVGVDLDKNKSSRQDAEIAAFTYNDAKYIRKEMQINNEDMYFIYTYITIADEDKKNIENKVNKVEGMLRAQGLIPKKAYFRQEQTFLASMPLMQNIVDIKNATRRNILTNSIPATFPFLSSSLFDETGLFVGFNTYNESLVFIDRYNRAKYKNSNVCVFGTSGSGKSFFTKLMIIRSALYGLDQYIIDPDREYENIAKAFNGTSIRIGPSSETFINIFDIREDSLEDDQKGYLSTKISKIIGFISLIYGELDEEDRAILEEKIIKVYEDKGITFEDDSLYVEGKFRKSSDMPILGDLYKELKGKMKTKLAPFVKGSLSFFNKITNVNLDKNLIVGDIYELDEDNRKFGMFLFTELFWDKIKKERNRKKAIYLDEIWQLIGLTSSKEVASFIYKIFKTIRKYGGGAFAITQDVYDLFSLEEGAYGKSILNNSEIKVFFNLEQENIKVLEKFTNLSNKEAIEIKTLKRGASLMFVGEEHIIVKVEAAEYEKNIILKGE